MWRGMLVLPSTKENSRPMLIFFRVGWLADDGGQASRSVARQPRGIRWASRAPRPSSPDFPLPQVEAHHDRAAWPKNLHKLAPRSVPSRRRTQRCAKSHPAAGRIEVALELRRLGRFDPQQHQGRAIALAERAGATGELCLRFHGCGALETCAHGDLLEVDTKAGVAFLIAGIDRLGGLSTARVARAPRFISNSPSPVSTMTRRSRRASARPRPIIAAPPMASAML